MHDLRCLAVSWQSTCDAGRPASCAGLGTAVWCWRRRRQTGPVARAGLAPGGSAETPVTGTHRCHMKGTGCGTALRTPCAWLGPVPWGGSWGSVGVQGREGGREGRRADREIEGGGDKDRENETEERWSRVSVEKVI